MIPSSVPFYHSNQDKHGWNLKSLWKNKCFIIYLLSEEENGKIWGMVWEQRCSWSPQHSQEPFCFRLFCYTIKFLRPIFHANSEYNPLIFRWSRQVSYFVDGLASPWQTSTMSNWPVAEVQHQWAQIMKKSKMTIKLTGFTDPQKHFDRSVCGKVKLGQSCCLLACVAAAWNECVRFGRRWHHHSSLLQT